MRTTVTLDPDTEALLREMALKRMSSGWHSMPPSGAHSRIPVRLPAGPYRVSIFDSAYQPGVDRLRLNQLADELETEAFSAVSEQRP